MTPKEATGIQSQRMQISLECARDAAGLPLVNDDPPVELSPKAKSLIQRVCISQRVKISQLRPHVFT